MIANKNWTVIDSPILRGRTVTDAARDGKLYESKD